jgi:hypothetical protein
VDDSAESGLALNDRVWNAHLSAESWEIDDKLDGINIIRDKDKSCLFVLNQRHDVVETVLDGKWLLAHIFLLLAFLNSRSFLVQSLLLLSLRFWSIFVEELEGLCGGVAVEGVLELGDCGRDFEAEVEDLLLALQADVLWPLYHPREVAFGLDVLANAEVACSLLEERVLSKSAWSERRADLRYQQNHIPLPASWLIQPSLAGKARRQVSFLSEAIIEKRRSSANLVHQVLRSSFDSKETMSVVTHSWLKPVIINANTQ